MKKYIIDTDIGDDIDDAFALDFALRLSLDLVCVTTVFRNTRSRATIAKKLIALHGKNIPVYAGLGTTLDGESCCFSLCQWTPDLESAQYAPDNEKPEEAVEAILAAARQYKEDLTILAIGPLTNVAAAIAKDKEAMLKIGGIIMMGGDYVNHYAEWNIHCDVTAAEIVFSSGIRIAAFGHEVTSQARLSEKQQEYVLSMEHDPAACYLAELTKLWLVSKKKGWRVCLHDAFVVRYAYEPDFCKMNRAPVVVEKNGTYTRAMTVNLSRFDGKIPDASIIEYATDVDISAFLDHFINQIGYQPKGEKL